LVELTGCFVAGYKAYPARFPEAQSACRRTHTVESQKGGLQIQNLHKLFLDGFHFYASGFGGYLMRGEMDR